MVALVFLGHAKDGHNGMALKIIHVGLGGWGMDWEANAIPAVREQINVVAVVEAADAVLATAQATLGLADRQCFTTLDDALGAVPAEAVLITAPVEAHVPLAITAMDAGLHVLSEKPLAPTVDQAVDGIRAAETAGKVYMISQNYRQYPAPRTVARLVQERTFGEVGTVSVDFRRWDNDAEVGTHRHYQVVHPLLFDMAIHHWDLMRMVLHAEPVSVFVQQTDPAWSKYVQEASATAVVTMDNGVVVSYRGSWVSADTPTHWAGDWRMEMEAGLLEWTSRQGGRYGTAGDCVRFRGTTEPERPIPMAPMPVWGRAANLLALRDAITTGIQPETSARRNLPSLALMVATARSMESGAVEPVTLPEL